MKTLEEIKRIVHAITYKDWIFKVADTNGVPWFQALFNEPDVHTGKMSLQKSAKQILSYHMCDNEIIRVVYKTVKRAIEHEIDENFKYASVAIFNPHMNYTQLALAITEGRIGEDNRK